MGYNEPLRKGSKTMNDNFKAIACASVSIALAGVMVTDYIRTTKTCKNEASKIQKEKELDLKAIELAGKTVQEKIRNSTSLIGLAETMREFDKELAFQKIAVRF